MAEPAPAGITILPVRGIGEIEPGADLAALITAAAPWLADGDVLVVTSKIVSKAEGRVVALPPPGPERETARAQLLADETDRLVAARGRLRIVRTRTGLVLANAGIDSSNVAVGHAVLLPVDPDASAARLRERLRIHHGRNVAVVITDTMGRPWRLGLTDVAIGAAGLPALHDYRGLIDPYGNELSITQTAVVDELAAAADLVKGKTARVPVAVVRGWRPEPAAAPAETGARALVRPVADDLFPLGTAEARTAGLREAATLPDEPRFAPVQVPPGALERALTAASLTAASLTVDRLDPADSRLARATLPPYTGSVLLPYAPAGPSPRLARAGAAVHRLRAALAAEGLASAWCDDGLPVDLAASAPLGLIAVGVPARRSAP
jgi:coenzyme F420-0:L-glutamate ligase/coenzyme F420-1:gamma-L-glutamate ligase